MRRNKLHIPHPVRRLRRTGVVRSVVPPFPTRTASLDSRGSPRPFAIPLKRPRRGLWPPSLDHPRGLVCAKIIFESTKRDADASFLNWRGSRNTLRLFQVCVELQSVCARYATLPLQEERPIDFHTSNIQRAQTKRPARRIVRSGNPILWPPEGRSLRDAPSVNSTQKQYAFSAHKRYFVLQRLFSPHSFLARQKRMGRRRHALCRAKKAGLKLLLRKHSVNPQSLSCTLVPCQSAASSHRMVPP